MGLDSGTGSDFGSKQKWGRILKQMQCGWIQLEMKEWEVCGIVMMEMGTGDFHHAGCYGVVPEMRSLVLWWGRYDSVAWIVEFSFGGVLEFWSFLMCQNGRMVPWVPPLLCAEDISYVLGKAWNLKSFLRVNVHWCIHSWELNCRVKILHHILPVVDKQLFGLLLLSTYLFGLYEHRIMFETYILWACRPLPTLRQNPSLYL